MSAMTIEECNLKEQDWGIVSKTAKQEKPTQGSVFKLTTPRGDSLTL